MGAPIHSIIARALRGPIVGPGGAGLPWDPQLQQLAAGAVDPLLALAPLVWYRADDVTLSGSDATVIADRSGNGHPMTAVNAAQQIDGALGQKALDVVAASSHHYQADDVGNPGSGTLESLTVAKFDSVGTIVSKRIAADGWFSLVATSTILRSVGDGTLATVTDDQASIDLTNPFFVRSRIRVGTDVTTFVDGTGTPTATDPGAISNTVLLTLFARADGGASFFDGQWYETIIFDRALSAGDLSTILGEWNTRYGLSKPGV